MGRGPFTAWYVNEPHESLCLDVPRIVRAQWKGPRPWMTGRLPTAGDQRVRR